MRMTNDQLRAFIHACIDHYEREPKNRDAARALAVEALRRLQERTP